MGLNAGAAGMNGLEKTEEKQTDRQKRHILFRQTIKK
jgi:hypothetical protein